MWLQMPWAESHKKWTQKPWGPSWMGSPWELPKEQMLMTQQWSKLMKKYTNQSQKTAILAGAACIDIHVTDWVTTQQEDPILKTMIEWISGWKVQDLKHLLGDDANTEEGKTILWEQKKLMLYQWALYHCHTPADELEEVLQFIVLKTHWVAAMNRYHCNAGHQGQQWTLYLLHDQFWWPRMTTEMQKAISSCKQCIQHEGIHAKAPMWPIIVIASLELLHIDFTSIETTMELDQPPNVVNLLVFCNHFTKHIMAYVTPNQTAKYLATFLWQGYISIFRAPAKLLSDQGANFESNIIREFCKLMGIQKVRTLPYHAQTNRQVEWAHQMLMHMIGKIGKGPDSRLAKACVQVGACLQLYEIGHHQIQPALFDV